MRVRGSLRICFRRNGAGEQVQEQFFILYNEGMSLPQTYAALPAGMKSCHFAI